MADDAPLTPEERDLLAAELALGLLEGEERARALRLQLSDLAFRNDHAAWQARLEPLFHDYDEVAAPDLWPSIEQRLFAERRESDRIERRTAWWRRCAIAGGAVAAGLAAILLLRPEATLGPSHPTASSSPGTAIARLGNEGAAHQFAASYDATSGVLQIRALRMPTTVLAPELWVIPADKVPRSLGLVDASGATRIKLTAELRALVRDGVTLAVTLEKREGAPHAAPGSAPVATGLVTMI